MRIARQRPIRELRSPNRKTAISALTDWPSSRIGGSSSARAGGRSKSPGQGCSITSRKGEKNVKRFALLVLILAACGDNGVATAMSQCDVTLTLVPSTIGSVSSPSGSGSGSGTGDTRQAALDQAYRAACSQLGLDNATRSACEQGLDFQVEGGSQGNIRLFSAVERSIRCSSSSES